MPYDYHVTYEWHFCLSCDTSFMIWSCVAQMASLTLEIVSEAIAQGGSIRAAAKLLGKSYTAVQWWLAANGYKVEYYARVTPRFALTLKGLEALGALEEKKGE
jgi:hypothetical protein